MQQTLSCHQRIITTSTTSIGAALPGSEGAFARDFSDGSGAIKCNNSSCPSKRGRKKRKGVVAPFACTGCQGAFYCSQDCQKADWENHKPACKQEHPQRFTILKMAGRLRKTESIMLKLRIAIAFDMLDQISPTSKPSHHTIREQCVYLYLHPTSRELFEAMSSPLYDLNALISLPAPQGRLQLAMVGPPDMKELDHPLLDEVRIRIWTRMRALLDASGNRDAFVVYTHFIYGPNPS
ncbi:unnamed protein product [Cyclocybe aegerita]|uniref:MYND-type domain-containing protein n=1 Tax=Cyclocybe aegerita TaxID=1973307 RepID=A0A8S0VVD2_CYCAE|nr:unnamed protein product [Cyclocybe aegerita]